MQPDDSHQLTQQQFEEMKRYISEEIMRIESLPASERDVLLEPWVAPIRSALEAVRILRDSIGKWVDTYREEIRTFHIFLLKAARVAADFALAAEAEGQRFEYLLTSVERTAQLGWTLPTFLSLKELAKFAELREAESSDRFILETLERIDPELQFMERRLLCDARLREFETLLSQCFRSIRAGDFAIAIPALMAILERVIQNLNPPELAASTDVRKTLQQDGRIAESSSRDIFCAAVYLSLATVIGGLWKQLPLAAPLQPEIGALSRPGIQHGRIAPPNAKVQVLRLLNTIETGLALHDQLANVFALKPRRETSQGKRNHRLESMIRASLYLPRGSPLLEDSST
jgi:hypothetical protein